MPTLYVTKLREESGGGYYFDLVSYVPGRGWSGDTPEALRAEMARRGISFKDIAIVGDFLNAMGGPERQDDLC